MKSQAIPMSEIRARYNPGEGRHWFDRSSMRFFLSRLPKAGYEGPGGVFFVSSEQFVGSQGASPRRFTVRQLTTEQSIETVGEFNELDRAEATRLAKQYAAVGVPTTPTP
jgi:hypothetical protein